LERLHFGLKRAAFGARVDTRASEILGYNSAANSPIPTGRKDHERLT
jgi:hypothetical protein